jgi:diguanylate cyclase (GGDEF)-like protein
MNNRSGIARGLPLGTGAGIGATLVLFFGVYAVVPDALLRHVLLYLLVTAGLYWGFYFSPAVVFFNLAGLLLLLFTAQQQWWPSTAVLFALLSGTSVIPFYYEKKCRDQSAASVESHALMAAKAETIGTGLEATERARQELEQEIDRIHQLYVLGRELVEHIEMREVVEHLSRILLARPGMRSIAMFSWEKSGWRPLYFSNETEVDRWTEYIHSKRSLVWEKRFRSLPVADGDGEHETVFWPVRLEKELLAAIILVVDKEKSRRYAEDGAFFIPQIALGLRRTRLFSEVRERSRHDGLTGLYLRRYFIERLQAEIQRGKRYRSHFALLMLDIDYFKQVNDTYGHLLGDKVLCTIARLLVDSVRPGDLVGRFGGEEFIILLPFASSEEALRRAQAIQRLLAQREFSSGKAAFRVTVSIGIGCYPQDGGKADELVAAADRAMYRVKEGGRNGIAFFHDNKEGGK